MGRKKGKQHGEFGSKAMRAVHSSQIQSYVQDARMQQLRERTNLLQSLENKTNSNSIAYKSRVHVGVLRGLLMERLIEDRGRDAMFRRAISNSIRPQEPAPTEIRKETKFFHRPGWLISFNHKEALAGIKPIHVEEKVHSLQHLCVNVLAPNLNAYIKACGKEYIRDCLFELPASLITEMSTKVKNVNDDVAYVLGFHSHLRGLVLNATSITNYDEEYVCSSNDYLSISGLLQLSPSNDKYFVSTCEMEIDWESLNEDMGKIDIETDASNFKGNPEHLERLELHNFQTSSVSEFLHVIQSFKRLTHLSLSNCFDSITGPRLFFGSRENNQQTLIECIPNLQVLDFTDCSWLTYELLNKFAQLLGTRKYALFLDMVSIQNCCESISECRFDQLNSKTHYRPQFVSRPYPVL
jgi:hypothetical protein